MKSKLLQVFVGFATFVSMGLLLTTGVHAQNSSLLPQQIVEFFELFGAGGSGAAPFITGRVRLALIIALGLIILVAVVYSLLAAFKYIQSQGDPGKIEEAQKAIKAILMGVAAMLIAIVGIVLVFVFFGTGFEDPSLTQTCISAPNSLGCNACLTDGINDAKCLECEAAYEDAASIPGGDGVPNGSPDCIDPLQGGTQWP